MAAGRAVLKLGGNLKEIRIHLCQKSPASKGVRDFIESNYVGLKQNNPSFPILIRECSGVKPKLWARYAFGRETSVPLDNFTSQQVLDAVQFVAQKAV